MYGIVGRVLPRQTPAQVPHWAILLSDDSSFSSSLPSALISKLSLPSYLCDPFVPSLDPLADRRFPRPMAQLTPPFAAYHCKLAPKTHLAPPLSISS